MADKAWKVWEREVSRDHGGSRTGPRGFGLPDSINVPLIGPECKYTTNRLIFNEADMEQARENASRIGKIPVLFLKEKRGRRAVRLDYEDWLVIYGLALKGLEAQGGTSLG